MTAGDNRAEWWSHAACSATDSDLFFPLTGAGMAIRQIARAKAICARCQIRQACLEYALEAGPIQGVWGGMTERERRLIRQHATVSPRAGAAARPWRQAPPV